MQFEWVYNSLEVASSHTSSSSLQLYHDIDDSKLVLAATNVFDTSVRAKTGEYGAPSMISL